ncbi:MAG: phosphotransferase family protein [Fimbriimonadaceae bacterium]|nr:phosphotransferase family protein [Alphaproteobacteria bacterium]
MDDSPINRQQTFEGTKPVSNALRFDEEKLCAYLEKAMPGFKGPLQARQFKGGQSNPTYRIKAGSGTYVLRRKPPGKLLPSAHAVDREFRVIKALGEAGFPVPKAHHLCTDETIIGTMFYLMDFVEGRVIWEPHMPGMTKEDRSAIFVELNHTIAKLHSYDPQKLGLGDFGKPANYVARQVSRWSKQYLASQTEDVPAMDRLIAWLPDHLPVEGPATLIHGDFRLDNTILHATEPKILAVLDWELSTLGDPLADFTYHMMQWELPPSSAGEGVGSLQGHDFDALGIPSFEQYIDMYCKQTGRTEIPDLDIYFAYNFFRLAAIFQGIVGRVRDGTATSKVAQNVTSQVEPLARIAWRFAERAGA